MSKTPRPRIRGRIVPVMERETEKVLLDSKAPHKKSSFTKIEKPMIVGGKRIFTKEERIGIEVHIMFCKLSKGGLPTWKLQAR